MAKPTVEITGVGRVFVKTDATAIKFCGALTTGGDPVNVTEKKVSRDKKHEVSAMEVDACGYWLREVKPGHFVLVRPDDES